MPTIAAARAWEGAVEVLLYLLRKVQHRSLEGVVTSGSWRLQVRTFQALSNQNVWQHKDLLVVQGSMPLLQV